MFSNLGHVMTLANSIIGVGILAMPFCFQKCGIILAILLLITSNWVTRICCHYLIKCSLLTRRRSFEFLGFHAFGTSGKLLVELCIIGYLLGTCITYFVVVGDLGPQIVTKMLSLEASHIHLRTWVMVAVTLICVLPLGMLKNVESLSTVCTASIGFYICFVIKIILESEEHIVANNWNENVKYWEPAGMLQCLPIFSMALSCQMQLFEVFGSINNQSLEKLNGIVKNATWICTSVYVAVGFFGYVAFCTQSFSGNILLNFSPSFGSDVIKIGFVLSVAFSFPLVIFPCRASIYSLLYRRGHTDVTGYIPESRFKAITIFIVCLSLCIALLIPSVELVIGLVGSTIGVAICIMFPALCYRQIVKKQTMERTLAQLIFAGGFCLMILGTYANLNAIDEQRSGAHIDVPNVNENLLHPTPLPDEVLNVAAKQFEVKNSNQSIDPAKVLGRIKEKAEAVGQSNQQQLILEKPLDLKIKLVQEPSPPPLPVDENHEDDKKKIEAKLEKAEENFVEKPQEKLADKIKAASKINVEEVVPIKENNIILSKDANIPVDQKNNDTPSQGINKEAIKKDEEIAAEETKNENTDNDELKKTQNELKKTKELLERTVDELKEELAKQNKETQDLVVEKLGVVVEKVEQIQKKVEQAEPKDSKEIKVEKKSKQNELEDSIKPKNKGSLVGILSENANIAAVRAKELKNKQKDIQPISYKTGELTESLKNASNLKKRMRLPLPLLINATQSKTNTSLGEELNKRELNQNQIGIQNLRSENTGKNNAAQKEINPDDIKLKHEPPMPVVESHVDNNFNKDKEIVAEKENVEAIRRDILQLKNKQLEDVTTTKELQQEKHERIKRSNNNVRSEKNCLSDNNIETIILLGVGSAIESKMQIGRKLQSVHVQDKK